MEHVIMGVPRDGDVATYTKALTNISFEALKQIMAWTGPNDHLYDFQLTQEQIQKIEQLLSEKLPSNDLDLFLICCEWPLGDTSYSPVRLVQTSI